MWVIVTEINEKIGEQGENKLIYKGQLDNSPYELKSIKIGDLVTFSVENIIDTDQIETVL